MKLTGLLVLLLGLAAVAFAVKTALNSTAAHDEAVIAAGVGDAPAHAGNASASGPKRSLDNVRARAKELEKEEQQHLDDMEKQSEGK